MTITPYYAAVVALGFAFLSFRTLRLRRALNIDLGEGGDKRMQRAMRVHANFAEYAPLTLLVILMFEMRGGDPVFVHLFCLMLVVGRLVHALGVSRMSEDYRFRVAGMAMTLTALVGGALAILVT
jgi:uncharacterized membrane protein YecN with MAPEG domain